MRLMLNPMNRFFCVFAMTALFAAPLSVATADEKESPKTEVSAEETPKEEPAPEKEAPKEEPAKEAAPKEEPAKEAAPEAETPKEAEHGHSHAADLPKFGVAVLMPTKGNKTFGILRLTQKGEELQIQGKVMNLTPGEHGFHIHEFGDRRGPEGKAAGGHFNPDGHDHGAPGSKSHAGDLGNIMANDDGVAVVDVTTTDTSLHFILGRSFVVHAGKDDLKSQPSGDAGPRAAVGVIGIGNPDFKLGQ